MFTARQIINISTLTHPSNGRQLESINFGFWTSAYLDLLRLRSVQVARYKSLSRTILDFGLTPAIKSEATQLMQGFWIIKLYSRFNSGATLPDAQGTNMH